MSKRRTKPDETRTETYGNWAVLTDCREPNPYRELWCACILQAIINGIQEKFCQILWSVTLSCGKLYVLIFSDLSQDQT